MEKRPQGTGNNQGKVGKGRPPVHSRFKPGESGNPKGRPVDPPELKDFKTAMKTFVNSSTYIRALQKRALAGQPKALEMAAHYGAGKPTDTLNVTQESYEDFLKRMIEKEKADVPKRD